MNEKKVIAVIVEGASDEAALGSILKECLAGSEVQFTLVHGDITLKDYVSTDSILSKIDEQLDQIRSKYRYDIADFIKVIHIVDTDGVYIPEKAVKQGNVPEIQYCTDHIDTKNAPAIISRNRKKGEILFKLRKTGKVHDIPYRVYFNSCNLEHVLYGELKPYSKEEKQELSDDFADQYEGKAGEFVEFISGPDIAAPGTYQKTWDYIEKDRNSLNRYSNMHLIFEREEA